MAEVHRLLTNPDPGRADDLEQAVTTWIVRWHGGPDRRTPNSATRPPPWPSGRLDETRLVAVEDRAVAQLALGQHATVAGDLEALTTAHPLRERLWALRAWLWPARVAR